jgi:hypothetical protein
LFIRAAKGLGFRSDRLQKTIGCFIRPVFRCLLISNSSTAEIYRRSMQDDVYPKSFSIAENENLHSQAKSVIVLSPERFLERMATMIAPGL